MTDVPGTVATTGRRWRPLGHQMLLGIAGLLALVVVLALTSIALVANLNHQEVHLNSGNVEYTNTVQSAAFEAKGIANDQRGFLLSGDDQFLREAAGRVAAARGAFASASAAASGNAERDGVSRAHEGLERWISAFQASGPLRPNRPEGIGER